MKFFIFVMIVSAAFAKKTRKLDTENSEVGAAIQKAKAILTQGKRKEAVELLDKLASEKMSKAQRAELDSKRSLFVEQFLTSDSFQRYEEAKGLAGAARADDCLRELEGVSAGDRDNIVVLRLKAACQVDSKAYDQAQKTYQAILATVPGDLSATFGSIEIDVEQKQYVKALKQAEAVEPKNSLDVEKQTLLRAKLYELTGDAARAEDVLRRDHEAHLDHIVVIFELGMLYTRMPGRDWPARKMLSLYVTRCRRMSDAELKARRFDATLQQAQSTLAALDRKLGV